MIETFIIDWPVLAFFGFAFGDRAGSRRWWRSPAFAGGLTATGGFATAAMLSNKHAPDWMWMYLRDPREMKKVTDVMPIAYALAYVLAFASATRMARPARRKSALVAAACEVAIVGATWDRYHRVGTREEWEEGRADELVSLSPQGRAKKIASYTPLVAATLLAGVLMARRDDASSSRR